MDYNNTIDADSQYTILINKSLFSNQDKQLFRRAFCRLQFYYQKTISH